MMKYEGVSTPWGKSQGGNLYMPGVTFYHTAGHGGLKVFQKLNREIPAAFRCDDGWYEEDCDFAIPFYFLHDAIREHCLTHGLEGHTMSAEEWFGKYDKAYYRSVIERYRLAACVFHFGTDYSDEQLKDRFIDRAQLGAEIAFLKRKLTMPKPKPGHGIVFDKPISFTSGREFTAFTYEGRNNFRTPCGCAVRITRWRQYAYSITSPLGATKEL